MAASIFAPMIRRSAARPIRHLRHAPLRRRTSRVIVGSLQNPKPHRGQVYPRDGPVEFTYAESRQVSAAVLGWWFNTASEH